MNHYDVMSDHEDAGYYIGASLVAKKSINIYNLPEGNIIKVIPKNGFVGVIYSYVLRNGEVWWMLMDNTYVKHVTGNFDINTAIETSSGKKNEDEQKRIDDLRKNPLSDLFTGVSSTISGAGNLLNTLGDNLSLIVILLLIYILTSKK